jgi:hypothetical protein
MVRVLVVLSVLAGCERVFGLVPVETHDAGLSVCCVPDQRCGAQATRETCEALQCMWSSDALCVGTHTECVSNTSQASCEAHTGCGWAPAICTGTHAPCATFAEADCSSHACTDMRTCEGTHPPCLTYDGNEPLCESHACSYAFGQCSPPNGWSSIHSCASHAASGAECTSTTSNISSCAYEYACGGQPHGCEAHEETACTQSCAWSLASCSGSPEACSSHPEVACESHESCVWSADGGCAAPGTCSERDLASCTGGCVLTPC